MRLVQRQQPRKVAPLEVQVQMCTHPGCVYHAGSNDVFCYYHTKIHAGLLQPGKTRASRKRFKDKGNSTERLIREWDLGRELQ